MSPDGDDITLGLIVVNLILLAILIYFEPLETILLLTAILVFLGFLCGLIYGISYIRTRFFNKR